MKQKHLSRRKLIRAGEKIPKCKRPTETFIKTVDEQTFLLQSLCFYLMGKVKTCLVSDKIRSNVSFTQRKFAWLL